LIHLVSSSSIEDAITLDRITPGAEPARAVTLVKSPRAGYGSRAFPAGRGIRGVEFFESLSERGARAASISVVGLRGVTRVDLLPECRPLVGA
jgi:hypothetical protein